MEKLRGWVLAILGAQPKAGDQAMTALRDQTVSAASGEQPLHIHRERFAGSPIRGQDFKHRLFRNSNGANVIFENCDFSYSIFEKAYFHGAKFKNCNFTGCRFIETNMRMASLYNCDLRYALFYLTLLEVNEIIANLPLEPNLRRDILQNLRANAVAVGDAEAQRVFVLGEIEAKADHLRRAVWGSESYYREKFGRVRDKARALISLIWLRVGGFVWGHGEKAGRIFFSAFVLIFLLSLINIWSVLQSVAWSETNQGVLIFKYCLDLFIDFTPDQKFRGFLVVDYLLISMRYIYVGLFVSVLFKGISHR